MKKPLLKYRVTEDIPENVWYKDDIRWAGYENIEHALRYIDRIEILECPEEYRGHFNVQKKKPVLEINSDGEPAESPPEKFSRSALKRMNRDDLIKHAAVLGIAMTITSETTKKELIKAIQEA